MIMQCFNKNELGVILNMHTHTFVSFCVFLPVLWSGKSRESVTSGEAIPINHFSGDRKVSLGFFFSPVRLFL